MYLDLVDIEILELLKQNARLKLTTLAETLNLSPATIKYRIDRLVQFGIIDKFTILLNRKKVGYEILAYLIIYATSKIKINSIVDALKPYTQISKISVLMGDPDLIASISLNTMNELIHLLNSISQIEAIQTFKTWFVSEEIN